MSMLGINFGDYKKGTLFFISNKGLRLPAFCIDIMPHHDDPKNWFCHILILSLCIELRL